MGKALVVSGMNASGVGIGKVDFGSLTYWVQNIGDGLSSVTTGYGFSDSYRVFYGNSYAKGSSFFAGKTIVKCDFCLADAKVGSLVLGECDTDGNNPVPLATITDVSVGYQSRTLDTPIQISSGKTLYFQVVVLPSYGSSLGVNSISSQVPDNIKGVNIINISSGVASNYPNFTIAIDFAVIQ